MDDVDRGTEANEKHNAAALAAHRAKVAAKAARPSALLCAECEEPIPEPRRQAIPGCQLCIAC